MLLIDTAVVQRALVHRLGVSVSQTNRGRRPENVLLCRPDLTSGYSRKVGSLRAIPHTPQNRDSGFVIRDYFLVTGREDGDYSRLLLLLLLQVLCRYCYLLPRHT